MRSRALWPAAASVLWVACTPTLDWREVRPADSGAVVLLPCKPNTRARTVALGDANAKLHLHACSAGGVTWALAHADIGDPAAIGLALSTLRESLAANLGTTERASVPWWVSGMTPNAQALRVSFDGRLPAAGAVHAEAAFFAKGTRVCQTTAVGPHVDDSALSTYFGSVKLL